MKHDWELELGAVIGTEAYRVSPDEALGHVAGYTIVNDITTRYRVFRADMPGNCRPAAASWCGTGPLADELNHRWIAQYQAELPAHRGRRTDSR